MRITICVNASSATLRSSLRELERQWDAMSARYPDMQRRGEIAGAEAERRLRAHRVAMDAVAELARLAAEAERGDAGLRPSSPVLRTCDSEGGADVLE